MDAIQLLAAIDASVKVITLLSNATGANAVISKTVAARLTEGGRDWTEAEKKTVSDALAANKDYARRQLGLPDTTTGE